jgi:hypothetical protein
MVKTFMPAAMAMFTGAIKMGIGANGKTVIGIRRIGRNNAIKEGPRAVSGQVRRLRETKWIRRRCAALKEIGRRAAKGHSAVATMVHIVAAVAVAGVIEVAEVLEVEEVLGGAVADARKSVGRFWQR